MKILFVENNLSFAEIVIGQFLSKYEVTVVSEIRKALAELEREHYDIILADYDLDDGKGAELVNEIRERGSASGIIAVSSHEHGNSELMKAGADTVCPKLEFRRIETVIEKLNCSKNEENNHG